MISHSWQDFGCFINDIAISRNQYGGANKIKRQEEIIKDKGTSFVFESLSRDLYSPLRAQWHPYASLSPSHSIRYDHYDRLNIDPTKIEIELPFW